MKSLLALVTLSIVSASSFAQASSSQRELAKCVSLIIMKSVPGQVVQSGRNLNSTPASDELVEAISKIAFDPSTSLHKALVDYCVSHNNQAP